MDKKATERTKAAEVKERDAIAEAQMLTIPEVAKLLQCCERHISNLRNRSEIPQPATVGARNVRWPRRQIVEWIDAGCPALAV